jgi:hypothetical protein
MNIRRAALVAALVAVVAGIQPTGASTARQCEPGVQGKGEVYRCLVLPDTPHGFKDVLSMTYCFGEGNWSYGGYDAFALPQQLRPYASYGPDTWSTTPGLRVDFSNVGSCTSAADADVWVYGYHGRRYHEGGNELCMSVDRGYCKRAAVRLTVDYDVTTAKGQALLRTRPCTNSATCSDWATRATRRASDRS